MTVRRTLLLSLRPRFANAILSGEKTIEIRRRPVNAASGTPIILYASSPTMAIVGTAQLRKILVVPSGEVWKGHWRHIGLTRDELDDYLDGSDHAYLLLVQGVQALSKPLFLSSLREDGPFQPPQSFRYVAASDPAMVRELASVD